MKTSLTHRVVGALSALFIVWGLAVGLDEIAVSEQVAAAVMT